MMLTFLRTKTICVYRTLDKIAVGASWPFAELKIKKLSFRVPTPYTLLNPVYLFPELCLCSSLVRSRLFSLTFFLTHPSLPYIS